MSLKVGILTIGSLYWDPNPARQRWRTERLHDEQIFVEVPIRYGRKSRIRGIYTMVFSPAADNGQARVLNCRKFAETGADLIAEATALWTAEKNGNNTDRLISANWGCVALITNPARKVPRDLLSAWTHRVSAESANYKEFVSPDGEDKAVTAGGILNIQWPRQSNGEGLDFDLLLATANHPFPCPYANAREIADALIANRQHADYFHSNRANGILTFEDDAIVDCLCHS